MIIDARRSIGRPLRGTEFAGRPGLIWRVVLPGAMPSILVGVRYGLGVTWLTLIVAETISADAGIGYLAMNAREFLQADVVIAAILLYSLLGKLADLATRLRERWLLPWHDTLGGRGPGRSPREGSRNDRRPD
jgi:sulfonate transport system permease protein